MKRSRGEMFEGEDMGIIKQGVPLQGVGDTDGIQNQQAAKAKSPGTMGLLSFPGQE